VEFPSFVDPAFKLVIPLFKTRHLLSIGVTDAQNLNCLNIVINAQYLPIMLKLHSFLSYHALLSNLHSMGR